MGVSTRNRLALAVIAALSISNAWADADAGDSISKLPGVSVTGEAAAQFTPQFPSTSATITADQIDATINAIDVEDAVKYLPSLFVRKRNFGDTQPVLATRTWGLGSSARSLVYVDDIPISALIANNNTIGAPRWGVISPDEIGSVTMLYGPFSAAYPGNSLGGVLHIETKEPQTTQVTLEQTFASQHFDLYDTHGDYPTSQTTLGVGGRSDAWHGYLSASSQNSFSQPLAFVTATSLPSGTQGGIPANNKLGQTADVLGAGGEERRVPLAHVLL